MICRHCCRNKVTRPRGLCWNCFYTPGVRDLYPAASTNADGARADATAAELDAIIVEQRAKLPPWWDAETARVEKGQGE